MSNSSVSILMATYNGSAFLSDQLDSFAQQTHTHWALLAADDGSTDQTESILKNFQNQHPGPQPITILKGPQQGHLANFRFLVDYPMALTNYYAYSDQDDIWNADKLERGIAWLDSLDPSIPALYCGRTQLVDTYNNPIGFSPLFAKKPSFLNALVQNIGGGNTMIFNQATLDLLRRIPPETPIVAHDWWTYLLVAGQNGLIYYDPIPSVRYRQHGRNQVGSNMGFKAYWQRLCMLFKGRFKQWNETHIHALEIHKNLLSDDNQRILESFAQVRDVPFIQKLLEFRRLGFYRQTKFGNIGLLLALTLNKL